MKTSTTSNTSAVNNFIHNDVAARLCLADERFDGSSNVEELERKLRVYIETASMLQEKAKMAPQTSKGE
jgi:hypothetical protein